MRLVTFQQSSTPMRTGIQITRDSLLDIAAEARARDAKFRVDTMLQIIGGGNAVMDLLREIEASPKTDPILLNSALLKAPIPRPAKNVFCVGWNYLEHFEEGGAKLKDNRVLPEWPVFFSKAPTAVNGPFDPIPYDAGISTQLDWEAELGVIIGKPGKNISEADAMNHVFGYTIINDVTLRDIQRRHGGQWDKGKSLDGTCPIGPCIVTADALQPDSLAIECRVSGVVKQQSSTRHLYFKLPRLIHDLSLGQTLEAGDIISTGTPPGVGLGQKPPVYLKAGNKIRLGIDGLGEQTQNVVAYTPQI